MRLVFNPKTHIILYLSLPKSSPFHSDSNYSNVCEYYIIIITWKVIIMHIVVLKIVSAPDVDVKRR